jgi:hypothetical protein
MSFLKRFGAAIAAMIKDYPALVGGAINLIVVLGARYGLHVTVDQVMVIFTALTVFISTFTHVTVAAKLRKLSRKPNLPA